MLNIFSFYSSGCVGATPYCVYSSGCVGATPYCRIASIWTQNIAVGSQDYLANVKSCLGITGRYREVVTEGDVPTLKEPDTPYMIDLGGEKVALSKDNAVIFK